MDSQNKENSDSSAVDADASKADSKERNSSAPDQLSPSFDRTSPGGFSVFPGAVEKRAPALAGISYNCIGVSDVGLVREHNEDNFLIADFSLENYHAGSHASGQVTERGFVAAVCDGMGGAAAGEIASRLGVETICDRVASADFSTRDKFARAIVRAVERASDRIYAEARRYKEHRGMGTTATAVGLIDEVLFIAQVGDSRCYLLRNQKLHLVTKDQSLVNQLVETGRITESEAEDFEHSNIILQALGTSDRVDVDLTFVELRRGDRVLVCSDGLSGYVAHQDMENVLNMLPDLDKAARQLIEFANFAGGHDNTSCVIIDFDGEGLKADDGAVEPRYQQYPLPQDTVPRASFRPSLSRYSERPTDSNKLYRESMSPQRHAEQSRRRKVLAIAFGVIAALAMASLLGRNRNLSESGGSTDATGGQISLVEVQVQSNLDDSNAELWINGRRHAALSGDKNVTLHLLPGSYRFEARAGDVSVSRVVEVSEKSSPLVQLNQPQGISPQDQPSSP